jgi:hypothetical protein
MTGFDDSASLHGGTGPRSRFLPAFQLLSIGVIALAILAGIVGAVSGFGTPNGINCPSYPPCLVNQAHLAAALHLGLTAVLGLAIIGLTSLSLLMRKESPELVLPAVGSLVVVLVMGSVGAGVATGRVSPSLAPIQFLFLAILLAFLVRLLVLSHCRARRAHHASPHG